MISWPSRQSAKRRTIGEAFDPRHNALNLLRLFFAMLVIFSHDIVLGGYRSELLWGNETLGTIAVTGFFAISGFLIAASALRNRPARYLWQRCLRIFPGFWVCLTVTALVAGPIGWLADHDSLHGYWTAADGPAHYVAYNWFLRMNIWSIAGTPAHVPYPAAWDGSLWSLFYEFSCYLMVAALGITTLLRHRWVILMLWASLLAIALGLAAGDVKMSYLADQMLQLVPVFFAGVVLWLYRERVPDSRVLFACSLLLFTASTFVKRADVISGPPLAYVCIWLSIHLPGRRFAAKHDISYGTYIYAFVVAQVLAVWHVNRWGYLPFTLLTVAITLPLAGLSCIAVEQPALRLKRWAPRPAPVRPGPAAAPADPVPRASRSRPLTETDPPWPSRGALRRSAAASAAAANHRPVHRLRRRTSPGSARGPGPAGASRLLRARRRWAREVLVESGMTGMPSILPVRRVGRILPAGFRAGSASLQHSLPESPPVPAPAHARSS